jgi:hypothetical protein
VRRGYGFTARFDCGSVRPNAPELLGKLAFAATLNGYALSCCTSLLGCMGSWPWFALGSRVDSATSGIQPMTGVSPAKPDKFPVRFPAGFYFDDGLLAK